MGINWKSLFGNLSMEFKNNFAHTHTQALNQYFQEMHLLCDAAGRTSTLKLYLLLMVMCICNGWQNKSG